MAVLRRNRNTLRSPREYNPQLAAIDVRAIAQKNGVRMSPLDVRHCAESLGVEVKLMALPDAISGYLKDEGQRWEIGVNSLHHPNRQRFTVAHEIGHFVLHREQGAFEDGLLFRKELQSNRYESEANQFAALILMPELEFSQAYARMPIEEVARYFEVSVQAAKYRINDVSSKIGID